MKFAAIKNLPQLKHHLLPKTKAFSLIAKNGENKSTFWQIK